jgi:hypothetical protein
MFELILRDTVLHLGRYPNKKMYWDAIIAWCKKEGYCREEFIQAKDGLDKIEIREFKLIYVKD